MLNNLKNKFKTVSLFTTALTLLLSSTNVSAQIQVATLPTVPESWTVSIEGTTVIYASPVNKKLKQPSSSVRFTYSKRTTEKNEEGETITLDAKAVTDRYVKKNECKAPRQLGIGFYTAACPSISRDVVIVGEANNMYTVEITGEYTSIAKSLINEYVRNIVNGKRTFEDRNIGEPVGTK